MRLFSWYIFKEHLAPFVFALVVLMFILLTNFMLRVLDKFLGKGLDMGTMFEYVVLNMAWIIALAVPMAVLVATLMTFGRMSADNEITAMRTSGISYRAIIQPAVIFGLLVCLSLVYFNNFILPETNHKARMLTSDINRKRPDLAVEVGYFVDDFPGYGLLARRQVGDVFYDILIFSKDNSQSQQTIFADRGTMQSIDDAILMHLEDGEIHELELPTYREYRRLRFQKHRIVIPVDNLYLERRESGNRGDREMTLQMIERKIAEYHVRIDEVYSRIDKRVSAQVNRQLPLGSSQEAYVSLITQWEQSMRDSTLIHETERERQLRRARNLARGLDGDYSLIASYLRSINRYKVEGHKKFSIPVACLVFVLCGAPLGIMVRRGGFVVATSMSMGFFIIYWAMLIAGEELADRAIVSPVMGMWGPNMLTLLLGMWMILVARRERRGMRIDLLALFRTNGKKRRMP